MADSGKDKQPEVPTLRVELGFVGIIHLVASPITSIELDEPTLAQDDEAPGEESRDVESDSLVEEHLDPGILRIKRLRTAFKVTGKYTGFTEKSVPASLVWIVHYEGSESVQEFSIPGELELSNGQFEFKQLTGRQKKYPQLEVLSHRLFGKGWVDYRLTPQYPHAPSAVMSECVEKKLRGFSLRNPLREPGQIILFDNPLDVRFEPDGQHSMGTRVQFELTAGALTKKLLQLGYGVRLVIDEEDADEKKADRSKTDLHIERVWTQDNADKAQSWLIGCSGDSTPEAPRLEYPEANEKGEHEFFYRLLVDSPKPPPGSKAKQKKPEEVLRARPLFTLRRPSLEALSLSLSTADPGSAPRLVARGQIGHLDSRLALLVDLSLWRRSDKGRGLKFTRVSGPVTVPLAGGRFDAEVYEFFHEVGPLALEDELFWDWIATAKPEHALFATVCFNPSCLSKPGLPAYASLEFDPQKFDAFDEARGIMADPLKGGSLCSSESRNGSALVERIRGALRRISER